MHILKCIWTSKCVRLDVGMYVRMYSLKYNLYSNCKRKSTTYFGGSAFYTKSCNQNFKKGHFKQYFQQTYHNVITGSLLGFMWLIQLHPCIAGSTICRRERFL